MQKTNRQLSVFENNERMDDETKITVNHAEIQKWAEKYKAKPQIIDSPTAGANPVGIRLEFPVAGDEAFLGESKPSRDISWAEFFAIFEALGLAFVYPTAEPVDPSSAYRFIKREIAAEGGMKNFG